MSFYGSIFANKVVGNPSPGFRSFLSPFPSVYFCRVSYIGSWIWSYRHLRLEFLYTWASLNSQKVIFFFSLILCPLSHSLLLHCFLILILHLILLLKFSLLRFLGAFLLSSVKSSSSFLSL